MSRMQELFETVSKDSALKDKLSDVIKDAEITGLENTKEKLTAFAKEAGFDISSEEMETFFKGFAEKNESELSDEDLDAVAGGGPITDSLSSYLRNLFRMNCFRSDGPYFS